MAHATDYGPRALARPDPHGDSVGNVFVAGHDADGRAALPRRAVLTDREPRGAGRRRMPDSDVFVAKTRGLMTGSGVAGVLDIAVAADGSVVVLTRVRR